MEEQQIVIKACLLAGKLMMQSGAETYRVEDTMMRMASASGMDDSQCFVTPTGIIFAYEGLKPTHFVRIHTRGTDLAKIAKVNSISRDLANATITAEQALHLLEEIAKERTAYSGWLQIFAAAWISGSFLILFKGGWQDACSAMIAGAFGYASLLLIEYVTRVKFFAEFFAAVAVASSAFFLTQISDGQELDLIIIASVMPLVPGLLITNAVRDLMAGHLFSGISKGAEAMLTAFAIGAGVAVVFSLVTMNV